jgi:hypothetical protein
VPPPPAAPAPGFLSEVLAADRGRLATRAARLSPLVARLAALTDQLGRRG